MMLTNTPRGGKSAVLLILLCFTLSASRGLMAGECDTDVAHAVSVQGRVEVVSESGADWSPVHQGDSFCPGDRLRVGANSRAGLVLNDETLLRLAENTSVRISAPRADGSAWLDLLEGIAHFISRVKHTFQVNTPYVNASIEGTEFTVDSSADGAGVSVLEGHVRASNEHGEIMVSGGQRAQALAGQAPLAEAVVAPLDAVQWALYYPPVIAPTLDHPSEAVRQAVEADRRGDLDAAFSALAKAPEVEQDPALLVYRASLHLKVGGIDAARRDIDAALRLSPTQPEAPWDSACKCDYSKLHLAPAQADALALRSIIATVRNESGQALELAQQAVDANPTSPASLLALSYARQARFELPAALKAAKKATQVAPDNALAWSRLAQLQLMFLHRDAALEAAGKAVKIDPGQAQTQTTLGFARLIRPDLDGASESFEKAAALDQAAPLPRLGLGLVEIRRGELAAGRRQIETAANLDPGNALIRSYLGKAYYEEKRNQRAETQFALAKEFDPLDPTAWFYDAILKQSENRPVEALKEIQTSIALNDNRAVYRSRLLLDQDAAARDASQARIYQDLGFDQLARSDAYKSLQTSPQTHSAHRLLSDSYAGAPLYEKARMSELLQSQLLQPLNANPIQPQLAVSHLGILDGAGPTATGFSEYTPLFTRNGYDVQFNAIGGNNRSAGDDLILSGLKDRLAFSLGQFHYETDGWRDNNDLQQDIYDAFVQAALAPSTSIQFEYRHQEANYGDLAFGFEPDQFSPLERHDLTRNVGRIGLRHEFSPNSTLIASAIYQDLQETRTENGSSTGTQNIPPFGDLPTTRDSTDILKQDSIARLLELQLIQRLYGHIFTLSGGYYDEDYTQDWFAQQTITIELPVPPYVFTDSTAPSITHDDFSPSFKYVDLYSQFALPARINMTLGVVHEDYKSSMLETKQTSPKFGLTWEASKNLIFRAAYLESIAHPRHMEQTIEQTQVAGFNQLFDDIEGTEIKQFGLGVDAKLSRDLDIGAEFDRRDLQIPHSSIGGNVGVAYESRDEERSQAYLYWTAVDRLGISIVYENEQYEAPPLYSPQDLTTQRTHLGFSYHWPLGIYLQVEETYIDQKITREGATDRDNFWNLDSVFGYRLPKSYGKIEIIAKNILDKKFRYYDLSFYSGDQLMPQYQPERQLFARFTLNF
jgi:tetratricopeptide (TPR) repeat protein